MLKILQNAELYSVNSIKQTVQLLPSFMICSSLIQHVMNLGTRIAAAISSGSLSICPNHFSSPAKSASINGLQNLEEMWRCWSLVLSRVIVGTNHPICTLASPWSTSRAFETGLIILAYSDRKASSVAWNHINIGLEKMYKIYETLLLNYIRWVKGLYDKMEDWFIQTGLGHSSGFP